MDFIENLMKKFKENNKSFNKHDEDNKEEKEETFGDTFLQKIIDNVKLTIHNVHGRIENYQSKSTYSCGVKIKEISVNTTDSEWNPLDFFDRTKSKNKNEPIRKKCDISDIDVYWNSNTSGIIKRIQKKSQIQ